MSELLLVRTAAVPELWEKVAPMIKAATAYADGAYTHKDVLDHLLDGKWELWLSHRAGDIEACAVTYIDPLPGGKAFVVALVAGDGWLEHWPKLETVGKQYGCRWFDGYCARDGWQRIMPKHGYRKVCEIWRKELT